MILKFPSYNRSKIEDLFKSFGVPFEAFRFRKLDINKIISPLLWEDSSSKILKSTYKQQISCLDLLKKEPFKPQFIIIGTEKNNTGYEEAIKIVFYYMFYAFRSKENRNDPLWYSIYDNKDDKLIKIYKDTIESSVNIEEPSFLVLDNIFVNSNFNKLNKTQDIISKYRYKIPIILIVRGVNALEFSNNYLFIKADKYIHINPSTRSI